MDPRRIGVLDLGTNSTRLLVADVADGVLTEVERHTVVTRLGEGLEQAGRLAEAAIARVLAAVGDQRELIETHQAGTQVAVATSAVRDATNSEDLLGALRTRFGVDTKVISGEQEAALTFLGATGAGRHERDETIVIDIGGGSTEYVAGAPGGAPRFSVSTRMGSVRQTERHLHDDPPGRSQVEALRAEAHGIASEEVPSEVRARVESAIAVAGTATSLAAIEAERSGDDAGGVHGMKLLLRNCERTLARLASLPEAKRRKVPGLHPDRAPTIVAGVAILVESLRACALDEVEVSDHDLLHGAALTVAAGGEIVALEGPDPR